MQTLPLSWCYCTVGHPMWTVWKLHWCGIAVGQNSALSEIKAMQSMSASGWEEPSWEPSPGLEKSTPNCWDAAQGRVGIPSPGNCRSWPLDSRREKRSWFLCVRGSESVISSFFSDFWGCFISTSFPCSSAWAKTCLGELAGCCLGCWTKSSPFLISSLSPGEGGRDARREGAPGQTLCNSVCRAGWEFRAQLCFQFTALPWQLRG